MANNKMANHNLAKRRNKKKSNNNCPKTKRPNNNCPNTKRPNNNCLNTKRPNNNCPNNPSTPTTKPPNKTTPQPQTPPSRSWIQISSHNDVYRLLYKGTINITSVLNMSLVVCFGLLDSLRTLIVAALGLSGSRSCLSITSVVTLFPGSTTSTLIHALVSGVGSTNPQIRTIVGRFIQGNDSAFRFHRRFGGISFYGLTRLFSHTESIRPFSKAC